MNSSVVELTLMVFTSGNTLFGMEGISTNASIFDFCLEEFIPVRRSWFIRLDSSKSDSNGSLSTSTREKFSYLFFLRLRVFASEGTSLLMGMLSMLLVLRTTPTCLENLNMLERWTKNRSPIVRDSACVEL